MQVGWVTAIARVLALAGLCGVVAARPMPALADGASTVVASWVQYAPGSSEAALQVGGWGDEPASAVPTILVRAVVSDARSCPSATLDHTTRLLLRRRFIAQDLAALPSSPKAVNGQPGYPRDFVRPDATEAASFANGDPKATTSWGECEAMVPAGHQTVTLDGVDMKLPRRQPRTILVMADTGCRMSGNLTKDGNNQQNCNDPVAFPLRTLSAYEASFNPDLVLHVGDWFYRDTDCLTHGVETFPDCNAPASANYEVWGDIFDSWNADVFFPAKTLLAAAPWIMVRGNHESCGRGARGWFALLDPHPYDRAKVACVRAASYPPPAGGKATYTGDFEPSYFVDLGGGGVLVHDSSLAEDAAINTNLAVNYDMDLSQLLAAAQAVSPGGWRVFATHRPTFGLVRLRGRDSCASGPDDATDSTGNWTLQGVFNGGTGRSGGSGRSGNSGGSGGTGGGADAFGQGVPDAIGLFLSGHIHQFQYVNTGVGEPGRKRFPPQLIVGTGGSLLDDDCNTGKVPQGHADVPPFAQTVFPFSVRLFAGGSSETPADTYAHDEFGFALLRTQFDAQGASTGFAADIYTVAATHAGSCDIDFHSRRIACDLH